MFGEVGKVTLIDGLPQCHICGKGFRRLLTHVRQAHDMSAREYKEAHGLNVTHGILSQDSRELSREAALRNADKVIKQNLIQKGQRSRYRKGGKGRTKDQVSVQTLLHLREHVKTNVPLKVRQENMSKLGKSGLGNKARWGGGNGTT